MTASPELLAIPSLPGYFASTQGHVHSTRPLNGAEPMRRLSERADVDGYPTVRVVVRRGSRAVRRKVPRLVAEAFHGPRPDGLQIRHMDGDSSNNRPDNLRYGTAKENAADRERHGTTARGERSGSAVHTDAEVRAAVIRVLAGETQDDVAAAVGISQPTLSKWCLGEHRGDATAGLDLSSLRGRRLRGDARKGSKLSDADVLEIRSLSTHGFSRKEVAFKFDVHPATISRIARGLWRAAA